MKKYLLLNFLIFLLIFLGISCSSNSSNSEAAEPTSSKSKTEIEEEKTGNWELVTVVDEFGDEVKGEDAIIGIFDGKMSNSAISDSDMKVKVQVSKDKQSFITFFEYGTHEGSLPDRTLFKIKIKKENGEMEFVEQFSMNNMLSDTKSVLIEKVLAQESPLKINVDLKRASEYESTVYNFEIDPQGLKELLEK